MRLALKESSGYHRGRLREIEDPGDKKKTQVTAVTIEVKVWFKHEMLKIVG